MGCCGSKPYKPKPKPLAGEVVKPQPKTKIKMKKLNQFSQKLLK